MGSFKDAHGRRKIQHPTEPPKMNNDIGTKDDDTRNRLIKAIKMYQDQNYLAYQDHRDTSTKLSKQDWNRIRSSFDDKKSHLEKFKNLDDKWVTIEDQHLTQTILEAFGDDDKKKILTTLTSEPRTIYDVLDICDLPQTSGYRKINSLIDAGLIIPMGYVTTNDGKKVSKYVSVFDNLKIDIVRNHILVRAKFGRDTFSTTKAIYSGF